MNDMTPVSEVTIENFDFDAPASLDQVLPPAPNGLTDPTALIQFALQNAKVMHGDHHPTDLSTLALRHARRIIRTELGASALLGNIQPVKVIYNDFSGEGDNGNYDYSNDNHLAIEPLIKAYMDLYIHFDWYNNDGGGGDINWDVENDQIEISAYQRETQHHSQVDLEDL